MIATLASNMMTPQPSRLSFDLGDRHVGAIGTIDSHTADELLARLRDMGTKSDATLDLGEVDFIDSSGLRSIVTSHQEFEQAGTQLQLKNPSQSVTRLLEITGLLDLLHLS